MDVAFSQPAPGMFRYAIRCTLKGPQVCSATSHCACSMHPRCKIWALHPHLSCSGQ